MKYIFKILKLTLIAAAAVFMCLETSYAALPDIRTTLKIGLFYAESAQQSVNISSNGTLKCGYESNYAFVEDTELPQNNVNITFDAEGNFLLGEGQTYSSENNIAISSSDGIVYINGKPYRGAAELIKNSSGLINVINLINLDDYVKGVIASEMPSSWNIEALKAQAVCARNYAVTTLNKHSSDGFDLCATDNCQVYGGVNAETQSTVLAANETAGKFLMYNSSFAQTLFYSSNGGHTNNSKYVWGSDIPYLQAAVDPYETAENTPNYNWSVTFTKDEIKQKLLSNGVDIGDILNIEITNATDYGQVLELKITGSTGEKIYTNSSTRSVLGTSLKSQRYTVAKSGGQAPYILSKNGLSNIFAGLFIIDGSKNIAPAGSNMFVKTSSATERYQTTASSYTFTGHGWGHGLGMSQYGAKAMAEAGNTYSQILSFYFKGCTIEGE